MHYNFVPPAPDAHQEGRWPDHSRDGRGRRAVPVERHSDRCAARLIGANHTAVVCDGRGSYATGVMAWYDDDDGLDDAWLHEDVAVQEPLRTYFRLTHTRRYDLIAKMSRRFNVPDADYCPATSLFLWKLYEALSHAWEYGYWKPQSTGAVLVLDQALDAMDEDDFFHLMCDMKWDRTLRATVTPRSYEQEMRKALSAKAQPAASSISCADRNAPSNIGLRRPSRTLIRARVTLNVGQAW